jgi:hypothetical protein
MAGAPVVAFRFKKTDTIGAVAAEDDVEFLKDCFVETGNLEVLLNFKDPRKIIVGRTGSGKTALIAQTIDSKDRTLNIRPENLALAHVSNSTVLRFFSDLGVHLDLFFKLLWRHVFAVEVLRHRYDIGDEGAKNNWLATATNLFKGKKQRQALGYLNEMGKWVLGRNRGKNKRANDEAGERFEGGTRREDTWI